MDTRLDLLPALGLQIGEAHVMRNAGGLPTDDVLRSLAISQHKLGTTAVVLLHHTQCGMQGFDDATFRRELSTGGAEPTWDVPGFTDVEAAMRESIRTVRECPWLLHRDDVRGFVFEVETGALREVE
jgi:carbonic anhydrase